MSTQQKKKVTYTKQPIKAQEKTDRIVSNKVWLKGKTNLRPNWDIKLGDNVIVLSGSDKGKAGKVTKVMPREAKVLVEGVNIKKRHTKLPTQQEGQIVEKEFPIWIWSVALAVEIDGKTVATRIKKGENGQRISVKTGKPID
ncbi:MAG: 50S ribosomal protein L24 [Candidatus Melainabacteria bacterium]|jgi:large subunit ribosomal protein L24